MGQQPKGNAGNKGPEDDNRGSGGEPKKTTTASDTANTRGSSVQGPNQGAKGGPQGANQGGAPRGGSRVEPSHQQQAAKNDRGGH